MLTLGIDWMRRWKHRAVSTGWIAVVFVGVMLLVFGTCLTGFAASIEPVNGSLAQTSGTVVPERDYFKGPLKVITLNVAHGRKKAFNQILLSWNTIHKNVQETGYVLKATAADIVALQEADGPSWWSGHFDHVALLAKVAGFPWYARAGHMDTWSLHYGTALLARRPYQETMAHRFKASWPTPAKGFLLGRFGWYPREHITQKPTFVDVISVHLDFSRQSVRARQIEEIRTVLAGRNNPLIILGDFNSDWLAEDSVVREMTRQSGLQVYRPEATDLGTYGSQRLDWIVISADLEFISYAVLTDEMSDHLGVIAEIGLKP